jgi:hypothetical protein
MIFDYEGVKRALHDHDAFSSVVTPEAGRAPDWLVFSDPPRHTKLRAILLRAFTPQSIAGLEPRIRALSAELLDRTLPRGEMDLVAEYAGPLPTLVIAEMIGIPLRALHISTVGPLHGRSGLRTMGLSRPTSNRVRAEVANSLPMRSRGRAGRRHNAALRGLRLAPTARARHVPGTCPARAGERSNVRIAPTLHSRSCTFPETSLALLRTPCRMRADAGHDAWARVCRHRKDDSMTRHASAMMVIGVGLAVLGVGEGDASAQVTGPGVYGLVQGGMCTAERSIDVPNVSYYAGNGGIAATSGAWVQCPVTDVTGSIVTPIGGMLYIENTGTSSSTCYFHRVSFYDGTIQSTTSVVVPGSASSVQWMGLPQPPLSGGFYSLECYLTSGTTLLGYYINLAN